MALISLGKSDGVCPPDWGITAEAIRKPNSVPGTGYPEPGNDHSSKDADCSTPLATYPEARTGSPQSLPYLVLHQVGFA